MIPISIILTVFMAQAHEQQVEACKVDPTCIVAQGFTQTGQSREQCTSIENRWSKDRLSVTIVGIPEGCEWKVSGSSFDPDPQGTTSSQPSGNTWVWMRTSEAGCSTCGTIATPPLSCAPHCKIEIRTELDKTQSGKPAYCPDAQFGSNSCYVVDIPEHCPNRSITEFEGGKKTTFCQVRQTRSLWIDNQLIGEITEQ